MNLASFSPTIINDLRASKPTVEKSNVISLPARLRVENLEFGILKPLNFKLQAGKVLGVVGANGAGKSTLLKLLYRLYKPKAGNIFVNDQSLHKLSGKDAAKLVAAVVQEQPTEFPLTVLEIIKLGLLPQGSNLSHLSEEDEHHIEWVLKTLSLEHLTSRQFSELSGGERQRVMIGRALAQRPSLLIMDEPTNHLDIKHQLELLQLVKQLNITIVIALHDLNLAHGYTDEVLVLEQGEAIAQGETKQFLNSNSIEKGFSIKAERHQNDCYFTFSLPTDNHFIHSV